MITSPIALDQQVELARAELLEAEATAAELKLYAARGEAIRSISLFGEIETSAALKIVGMLNQWVRMDRTKARKRPIFLALNSFGGSTVDIFAVFDCLNWTRAQGHRVTIQVTGTAGLHAIALLQAADERVITPNSWLMLTEEELRGFQGDTANSDEKIAFLRDLEKQGWMRIAERSDVTIEQIVEKTQYGRQWWIPAEEAAALKIVDRVGVVGPELDEPISTELAPCVGDTPAYRLQKAEIRKARAAADLSELQSDLVAAQGGTQLLFFFPVLRETVLIAQKALEDFSRKPGSEIEIIINSPGGSVVDGLALMDLIEALKQRGHKVTTVCLGMAASMGGFLLQTGDHRIITANSRILIHRISRIFGGASSQVADQKAMMRKLEERAMPLLAGRSKLSVEQIMEKCNKTDWWLNAQEALELGFVDEIR